jgi:Tol biopolymer transport system component
MMAYVSDRGLTSYPVLQDNRIVDQRTHDPDIWIVDLSHTDKPEQVTTNGSIDDSPVWDPSGNFIYFISNRGGQWGIWKIGVK